MRYVLSKRNLLTRFAVRLHEFRQDLLVFCAYIPSTTARRHRQMVQPTVLYRGVSKDLVVTIVLSYDEHAVK